MTQMDAIMLDLARCVIELEPDNFKVRQIIVDIERGEEEVTKEVAA